jgi:methylthioribulose-1-phosphate dehydratase
MRDRLLSLIESGQSFYQRGWMLGTAGNLSVRVSDKTFLITASGRPKGHLNETDFLELPINGPLPKKINHQKPSAESIIHQTLYQLDPNIGSICHVHSLASNLVTRIHMDEQITLPAIEMIKGIGHWDEKPNVQIMVTQNHHDVGEIALELSRRIGQFKDTPGFLIRDHGITAWGKNTQEARNRCEIFCFLFDWMVQRHQLNLSSR